MLVARSVKLLSEFLFIILLISFMRHDGVLFRERAYYSIFGEMQSLPNFIISSQSTENIYHRTYAPPKNKDQLNLYWKQLAKHDKEPS